MGSAKRNLDYISKTELYGILEEMPIPIILTEKDKTVRFANRQALALGNYDNLAGRKCYETFCREKTCNCPVSGAEKVDNSKQRFYKTDGNSLPVLKNAHPVFFNNELFFAQFFTDLSTQFEKEEKLKEIIAEKGVAEQKAWNESKKFEQLFEGVDEAIFVHELGGKIIKVNRKAAERLEYTKEELETMCIADIVAPEFRGRLKERLQKLGFTGEGSFESLHLTKNGKKVPVAVCVNVVDFDNKKVVLGSARDITLRKQYENQLIEAKNLTEKNEAELQTIFNKVPSTIIVFDEYTCIQRINEKGILKFNKQGESVRNKKIGEIINCVTAAGKEVNCGENENCLNCKLRAAINKTIKNGKRYNKKEVALSLFENGMAVKRTLLLSTSVLKNNGTTSYIATLDDITERKNMENELVAAKEKAEVSEKLKTAFLNNISHEIRTPLNGLLGFLDFFEDHPENLSKEQRQIFISTMRKSGDRLIHTVEDIIEASKLDTGLIEFSQNRFQLKELTDKLQKDVLQYAGAKIGFRYEPDLQLQEKYIETDKSKLYKVLRNLLDNAFKFTLNGEVRLEIRHRKNKLLFAVEDSGIGISKKDIDVIFDPFRQADINLTRGFEGNGLGLTIAYKLVQFLGGRLRVKSKEGEGSRFYFSIPQAFIATSGQTISGKPENKNVAKGSLHGKTVLVAEDDDTNYLFMEAVMAKEGCRLLRARNGREAVELSRENQQVDMIIMDLKMPVMNGIEATLKIKELNPSVPIIAHSAHVLNNEREQSLAAGCSDYLPKPAKKKELLMTLEKQLLKMTIAGSD